MDLIYMMKKKIHLIEFYIKKMNFQVNIYIQLKKILMVIYGLVLIKD